MSVILILSAMEIETKSMEEALVEAGYWYKNVDIPGVLCNSDHEVHLHTVGVGKVNAAIGATVGVVHVKPDYVISQGCCAGVKGLEIGDVFFVEKSIQYDFNLEPVGYKKGEIPISGMRINGFDSTLTGCCSYKKGIIMTADKFCTSTDEFKDMINGCEVVGADMETAAIAHVCFVMGDKFIGVRSVSDVVGSESQADVYQENEKKACRNAARSAVKWINCATCTK